MNPTAAFPVTTLTEDQAVEELALIFDSAPSEEDTLARIHWSQEHAVRAQHLEAHILHLQRGGAPEPIQEDAPPQHLPLEPAKASAAPKEKTPVSQRKTPQEKMDGAVAAYRAALAKTIADPKDRDLRNAASNARSTVRTLARKLGLADPKLPPVPPLPDPKPKGGSHAAPRAPNPVVADVVDRFTPKAGPGPYKEPTAQDIQELLPEARPVHFDRLHMHVDVHLTEALSRFLEDARSMVPPWVPLVMAELALARAKFPEADLITMALAEEAGEVVKAVLDLRNGKAGATLALVHGEVIQTMAMCVRLLEEGDPAVLPVIPAEKAG